MVAMFSVGERVIGPQSSRALALFDIEEIYLDRKGRAVYKARRCCDNTPELIEEVQLTKKDGRFMCFNRGIWDVKYVHQPLILAIAVDIEEALTNEVLKEVVVYLNNKYHSGAMFHD